MSGRLEFRPSFRRRKSGELQTAGEPGTILGFFPKVVLPQAEVELVPGDALLLYTDRVTEARRGDELYGEERLEALVADCAGLTAEQIAERIEGAALEFQHGSARDDIAVLVLRVAPS